MVQRMLFDFCIKLFLLGDAYSFVWKFPTPGRWLLSAWLSNGVSEVRSSPQAVLVLCTPQAARIAQPYFSWGKDNK